jgi:hypothetical protein
MKVPANIKEVIKESLRDWFKKEKWVRISSSGKIAGDCGTSKNKKNPDRCLPKAKAQSLTKGQRAATAAKKKKAGSKGKTVVKNTKKATVKKEGLWANINAKKKAGKKSSHKNSNAYKDAKKAGNALKKEDGKLNEIGDLTQTPYKWKALPKSKGSKDPYTYYQFTTDNGTKYEVVFNRELFGKVVNYDMSFVAKTKDDGSFSSSALTGGNEPLKIMSTVVDITREQIKKAGDVEFITFKPTKGKTGEEGAKANTRSKLYKLIIKKNFPKADVSGTDTVIVDVSAYMNDNLKETKEDLTNLVVGMIHELKNEAILSEKDDRCTRLAKSKYDTWPSAYASGAVVRCRRGEIWKKK